MLFNLADIFSVSLRSKFKNLYGPPDKLQAFKIKTRPKGPLIS